MNNIETTSATRYYVPQLQIPYSLVDIESLTNVVPRQVEEGIYRLKSPIEVHIACGSMVKLKTGIKLHMPKYVDMSPCTGVPEGATTTVFPRVVMHAHLESIFDLLVSSGLNVLGPKLLSADETNGTELVVYLQNLGNKEFVAKRGDEIATLYFTIMPISAMTLTFEQTK